MRTLNWNVIAICAAAVISSAFFYLSVRSINATILQAAHIQGDKVSPANAPRDFNVRVSGEMKGDVTTDGTLLLGNRKGGALSVGMTMGKGE